MQILRANGRSKDISRELKELSKKEVLVGVPNKNAPRTPEEEEARKTNGEPINNAEIGYINEFGSPEANIPPRPHLRPGIRLMFDRIKIIAKNGVKKVVSGDRDAGIIALSKIGQICESSVANLIREGLSPALSPRTIAARQARNRTGTKPLLDTGQYRQSITSVVVDKEK